MATEVEGEFSSTTPPPLQFKEPTEPIEDPTTLDLLHVGAGPTKCERRVRTRFARLARKLLSAAEARAAAATQIQSARECKPKATEPLAAPKCSRTSEKAPQPAAEDAFKVGSYDIKPIRGIHRPAGELDGGAAGPKASSGKSPPQAPPEAPTDGGADWAKDPNCFTPHASEVSTALPESYANSETSSDATTPRLRPLRAMAT